MPPSCLACRLSYPDAGLPHRCPACRGLWGFERAPVWRQPAAGGGLRRFAGLLGLEASELPERPLAAPPVRHGTVWVSHQGSDPEGSFKERGAEVLAATAARRGLTEVFTDSSGNAGIALARACASRGLRCRVLVPETTASDKLEALQSWGAEVEQVPGDRTATARAAAERALGTPYASHVFQPTFQLGVATLVWELFLELEGRLPEPVILPVGNGSLLLGFLLGCRTLVASGRLARLPRLQAVQLAGYASLAPEGPGPRNGLPPTAAGLAIRRPPRREELRAALAETRGRVTVVTEAEIAAAREQLAGEGFHVDATGAAAWAGYSQEAEPPGGEPLIILTARTAATNPGRRR